MPRPPNIPKSKFAAPIKSSQQRDYATSLVVHGLNLHQQGNFIEAKDSYEKALVLQPNHFDALQLLGALSVQTKQFSLAVNFLTRALQVNPNHAACNSNYGLALLQLKRLDEALVSYDRAISINPNYADDYFNRGITLKELKRLNEALASYDKAISINPDYAEAYFNRGNLLSELKLLDEALVSYDKAISITPNHAALYFNRGITLKELKRLDEALASYDRAITINPDYVDAYINRGIVLHDLKRLDEALASYDRAITINPGYAEAYFNQGITLKELQRLDEALVSYDKTISIMPSYAEAYFNRGIALKELKCIDEALVSYDKAITINPDYIDAYINRGIVLQSLRRLDEALASYDKAISINPHQEKAHYNSSLINLLSGNLKDGWQGYEWRWKGHQHNSVRSFKEPLWLGLESLKDKTILIYAEQGLGDTIQFYRYVALVAKLGAKIILEVQNPLKKFLSGLDGICQIFSRGDALPSFDYQCPLLSLPLVFKTGLDSIPPIVSVFKSDKEKLMKWQSILGEKNRPRVGFAWSGNANHKNDHNRSLTLSELLPFLPSNLDYICLQTELRDVDKNFLEQHSEIKYLGNEIKDFSDTAALCECIDLVISVDTSVAHLAGTLNKQTWVLLPFVPDWRWLLDRDTSPWYPSIKLYRQENIHDWKSALEKVQFDLERQDFKVD